MFRPRSSDSEFEIQWENLAAQPTSTQRRVQLLRPDGTRVDLVATEQVDLGPGTSLVEPFSIDLTPYVDEGEGAAAGDHALVLEWTDAEGTDLVEFEFFTIGLVASVPLLPGYGALLLACAVATIGLRRMRRRS